MTTPFPGITIKITSDNQAFNYLNTTNNVVTALDNEKPVTNYEYEERLNDEKRYIKILKPEYLSAVLSDFKSIMTYGRSSQYVDKKTKKTYNPNITGI
jgi:hypothetical protein